MEPLNPRFKNRIDRTLTGLYVCFAWVPLIYALVSLLLQGSFDSLSGTFFWLLIRAALFGILQASLSVLTLAVFSFGLGYVECFRGFSSRSKRLFAFVGLFLFSLSPTFVALALLNVVSGSGEPPAGIGLIVLCHFLMNFGFVGLHFWRRIARFGAANSGELLLWLDSVGTSARGRVQFYLWPLFKNDFYAWAPQIFIWCFSSFAPVVLLGRAPQQATPEVLLYYSILNDSGGARIVCILLVSASLALLVNRLARRSLPLPEIDANPPGLPRRRRPHSLFLYLLVGTCIFPFALNFLTAAQSHTDFTLLLRAEFYRPMIGSLLMSALSFALILAAGAACVGSAFRSRIILRSNFLSAPFILLGWIELGLSNQRLEVAFALVSLGNFLAVFPWFYRQLKAQLDQLPADWPLLARSLGMSSAVYFARVLWPQGQSSVWRLATVISLWTLGEYAFSKALFDRTATLPLFIEENLRRYDFGAASIGVIAALLFSSALLLGLDRREPAKI